MLRLKGGELLLDLTLLGNLSDSPMLNDEQIESVKKFTSYDNNLYEDLPKPIICKCIIEQYKCLVTFNAISDDKTNIMGNVIVGSSIYIVRIDEDFSIGVTLCTLS